MIRQHGLPKAHGRNKVTQEDISILCAILHHFTQIDPNEDGTMPRNRIESVWASLFETGKVNRVFNKDRYFAARCWLMKFGFIEVIDSTYIFHRDVSGEKTKDGVAAKWKLSSFFYQQVAGEIDQSVSVLSSSLTEKEEGHTCGRQEDTPMIKRSRITLFKPRYTLLITDSDTYELAKIAKHFSEWVLAA